MATKTGSEKARKQFLADIRYVEGSRDDFGSVEPHYTADIFVPGITDEHGIDGKVGRGRTVAQAIEAALPASFRNWEYDVQAIEIDWPAELLQARMDDVREQAYRADDRRAAQAVRNVRRLGVESEIKGQMSWWVLRGQKVYISYDEHTNKIKVDGIRRASHFGCVSRTETIIAGKSFALRKKVGYNWPKIRELVEEVAAYLEGESRMNKAKANGASVAQGLIKEADLEGDSRVRANDDGSVTITLKTDDLAVLVGLREKLGL